MKNPDAYYGEPVSVTAAVKQVLRDALMFPVVFPIVFAVSMSVCCDIAAPPLAIVHENVVTVPQNGLCELFVEAVRPHRSVVVLPEFP